MVRVIQRVCSSSCTHASIPCKIDVNTLNNPWSETLIIMNINDYYRFMIYEQLENYNEYSIVYKKSLNKIMFLSNRKPGIEVNM